jgi:hypothetical protein
VITALLNWYGEPPTWLADCVASAARFCHHIVAVDGAYAAFPGALRAPSSDPIQAETILHTAHGSGMGCTLYVPREPWWGNEVEKRDRMWQLGQLTGADWLFSIDADEAVTTVPFDLAERLRDTDADVAEIGLTEGGTEVHPLRRLYRRLSEMHVEQTHYTVTALKDGRRVVLSGSHEVHALVEPLDLTDLRVEHRSQYRDNARKADKTRYNLTIPPLENDALAPIGQEAFA